MAVDVRLLDMPVEFANELARFAAAHPRSGGIASFIGQVRAEAGATAVLELELSHYPPLTLPGMQALADRALGRWPLDGLLLLQDKIASGNRKPAIVKPRTDPVPAAKELIAAERLRLGLQAYPVPASKKP